MIRGLERCRGKAKNHTEPNSKEYSTDEVEAGDVDGAVLEVRPHITGRILHMSCFIYVFIQGDHTLLYILLTRKVLR